MATLKFDLILQEFVRRIGDRPTAAFTPGGGAYPGGTILGASDAISYVNKALNKYFNDYWMAAGGDEQMFVSIFPELIKATASITLPYAVASPYLDFHTLFNGYYDSSTPCRIEKEKNLVLLVTGKYPRHGPTTSKPIMVALNKVIYIFPVSLTSGYVYYVAQPISPTTGQFLAQDGSEDSPFHYHHHSKIAEVAEQLYWNEKEPKP